MTSTIIIIINYYYYYYNNTWTRPHCIKNVVHIILTKINFGENKETEHQTKTEACPLLLVSTITLAIKNYNIKFLTIVHIHNIFYNPLL